MLIPTFCSYIVNLQEIKILLSEALAAMSWLELLAVLLGLAYVILAAQENIWCWPAALLSTSMYVYLCLEASLFAETGLQLFYVVMAIVGWWSWRRNSRPTRTAETAAEANAASLPIIRWPGRTHLLVLAANTAGTLLLGWLLQAYTGAANPYLDAFTTVFSLFTTWMVTQKVLENWLYWVVIDAASIFLYASRDLYLTALLFIIYTIIAVAGYFEWLNRYKTQAARQW